MTRLACAGLALLAFAVAARAEEGDAGTPDVAEAPPVLVELFTSQGCSSCPPADRLLSELAAAGRVIALAFHVDYWNYIGWTDPLSSARWSARQRRYAAALGSSGVYTPQLVVAGRWQGVGSDPREVDRLLDRAAADPRHELRLEVEADGSRLRVRVSSPRPPSHGRAWLAVVESGFETPVGRGENADRTLRNDHVVRRLEAVELAGSGGLSAGQVTVELDPAWRRDRVRLVAFFQDPETMAVSGAAQVALPRPARFGS